MDEKISKINDRELPEIRTKIQSLENEIQKVKNKLKETGWSYASERDKNQAKEKVYLERLSDYEEIFVWKLSENSLFHYVLKLPEDYFFKWKMRRDTKTFTVKERNPTIEGQLKAQIASTEALGDSESAICAELVDKVFDPYKNEEKAIRPIVHHLPGTIGIQISRILTEIAPLVKGLKI